MSRPNHSCEGIRRPKSAAQLPVCGIVVALVLCALAPRVRAQKAAGAGASEQSVALVPAPATKSETTDNPGPGKRFTLADFSWLAGRWQGQWGPRIAEQVWMSAKAGSMLGIFRTVADDKTLVVELLTLTETPAGVEYSLRHFTPALVPWEKSSPAVLVFASADAKKIIFENPVDGQPKHLIFEIVDANTYVARSEIVPEQGDAQMVEITYHRQKDAPAIH